MANIFLHSFKFYQKALFAFCFVVLVLNISATQQNTYVSDVIDVEEKMLNAEFWIAKLADGDKPLLKAAEIKKNNQLLYANNQLMIKVTAYPNFETGQQIAQKILNISKAASSPRYYANGSALNQNNYDQYIQSLNLESLPKQQKIQFGMVVRRTNMRTFPTVDKIYKTTTSTNLDRFQETALFPTEEVAILHESLDKLWLFVISYNYTAWVKKKDIAIGDKTQIIDYKNNKNFLVVTGSKITTSFNPDNESLSELQLEMGTVLPLAEIKNIPTTLGGQNTYTSYVIALPVRDIDGNLKIELALVARNDDVHQGFLSYTKQNLIQQSFKFLGERYGWGHSFNARDCTGFVGEIYKSFGILMPRNSGDQGRSTQGKNAHHLKTATTAEKTAFIQQTQVGDLIYIPGHVMMVLGFNEEKPFVIHDVSGMSYFKENGEYYKSSLNGVSITPLLNLQLSQEKSYLDKIYNIKKIK